MEASERLEAVLAALEPGAGGVDEGGLQEFARHVLYRARPEFLQETSPRTIARAVADLCRLAAATPPEGIGVRVRLEPEGPHRGLVLTAMPDCAFIVETLREHLHAEGYQIEALLHPVVVLERDEAGRVRHVRDRRSQGPRTSAILAAVDGPLDEEAAPALAREIERRLQLVRKATADFEPMVRVARVIAADLTAEVDRLPWRSVELEETADLLGWLQDGNYVFLGYREYRIGGNDAERFLGVEPGSSLGILSDEAGSSYHSPQPMARLPQDVRARLLGGPLLIVSKTNALSPVHRRARMDDVMIKILGADGEVLGARRFMGLFTAKAFSQDASAIPILRRKLEEILEAHQVDRGSHDHGLIVRIFNSLPKEELFLTPVSELVPVVDSVLAAHASEDVLLFVRPDTLGRGVKAMVVLPKRRFSGDIRRQIQDLLLEAYAGRLLNYYLSMGEGEQARLHFYVGTEPAVADAVDVEALRERIQAAVRSWEERLGEALEERLDRDAARTLRERYGRAFSPEYVAATGIATVVRDIESLESVRVTGRRKITLSELDPPEPHTYWLTSFARSTRYALSDVMPLLENLGFRVVRADVHEARISEGGPLTIHGFLVQVPAEWAVDRASAEDRVEEAMDAIQSGWAQNLALNSLILSAGLTWREVALIHAYGAYAFRIGAVSSRLGVRRPLLGHPRLTRLLFEIFTAQFDPDFAGDRESGVAERLRDFHRALESVRGIDDDRTLRRLLDLVRATVRTNYFQRRVRERPGAPIALKVDCPRLEFMPRPRPRHEVWVSSPHTEGTHLRMGDVARGGLRWSDRTEDFRVEVLGLVKTQQVKNAVIVPAGAKGTFVVNPPPADPAEAKEAGVRSYRDFVRALLEVTDNVVEGRVVHPTDSVIRDGEDPYLVVAADKGTATLSDTANELADEHGFWLGDAFASGGSKGYDHKEMGITARGGWECVKRHFREMGVNIQEEEFTVAGIGDMSGDVFGNGMLLSRKIRLVAAFDHRHIFLDPSPDSESSWAERKRLFDLPGSSWADYDPGRITAGGGVYGRGEKRIRLSDAAREVLGIEERELNGDALIQAILRAPVDLLWNGGIGTYVKATAETHVDVADPSNDSVRVDARELRAKVVGEGGNLGLTQRARVEFALNGGRINTDALDNSAGVDTSDHEVNLKILLRRAVDRGNLTPDERDEMLRAVEPDVARAVLAHSDAQSLAVSLDAHRVRRSPEEFRDALVALERAGLLDRQLEALPGSEDMLDRLEDGGPALTRPELAVLLAYSKLYLKQRLLAAELLEEEAFLDLHRGYFPVAVLSRLDDEIVLGHRLRRNIAATVLTNLVTDQLGGAGLIALGRDTHRDPEEVAKAWYVVHEVGGMAALRQGVRALDDVVPAGVQAQWLLSASEALARATRWLLANADLERTTEDLIEWYGRPVVELRACLVDVVTERKREEVLNRTAICRGDGLDEATAGSLVGLEFLDGLLPVAALAREAGADAVPVGKVYFGVARDIDFPWLQDRLVQLPSADLWEQRAAKALVIDLEASRTRIVKRLIEHGAAGAGIESSLSAFRSRCEDGLARLRRLVDELQAMETVGLASLTVAVHAIGEQCADWSEKETADPAQ